MLGLIHAGGGIDAGVLKPAARFGGVGDSLPVRVAVCVGERLDIRSHTFRRCGVRQEFVVFVHDEHIPLPVNAFGAVVLLGYGVTAVGVVARRCLLHQRAGVCARIVLQRIHLYIALIPAGAEYQPIVLDQPRMLALIGEAVGRVEVHIVHPLAVFVRGFEIRAEVVAGDVGAKRPVYVLADIARHRGMHDEFAAFVKHEQVEIALYAVHRVVVVQRRLLYRCVGVYVVARDCFFHIRLRGCRIACGRFVRAFVIARTEYQPVVAYDPGALPFFFAACGIGPQVIDPIPLFGSLGYLYAQFVAVVIYNGLDVVAQQILMRRGRYERIVFIHDVHIPLPVDAVRIVVVRYGGIAAVCVVARSCLLYEGARERLRVFVKGHIALIPAGAEYETLMAHYPGVFALIGEVVGGVEIHIVYPLAAFVHADELCAEVVAGDVRAAGAADVHPNVERHRGMNHYLVVRIQHEQVQVAAYAVHCVVVVESWLHPVGVESAYRFGYIGLCKGGRRSGFEPIEPFLKHSQRVVGRVIVGVVIIQNIV